MKRFLTLLTIVGGLFATGCTGVAEIKADKDSKNVKMSPEAQSRLDEMMKGSKDQMSNLKPGAPGSPSAPK